MRRKIIVTALIMISICLISCTNASSDNNDEILELKETGTEVVVGHYAYFVPNECKVLDSDSAYEQWHDKTIDGDSYVVRSFCLAAGNTDLETIVEETFPELEKTPVNIGSECISTIYVEHETTTVDGEKQLVRMYFFKNEHLLHVVGVWADNERQSYVQEIILSTVYLKYGKSEEQRRQEIIDEQMKEEAEQNYQEEYEPEPWEPPAGAWR